MKDRDLNASEEKSNLEIKKKKKSKKKLQQKPLFMYYIHKVETGCTL